jgi:N-acetylglucosamine-6-phosphate deacetylase
MEPLQGFIDLQVNGYGGVDFNSDDFTREDIARVSERLRRDGVAKMMPTIITASLTLMVKRINRLVEMLECEPAFASLVHGIHVEGPFISDEPGYIGAHPRADAMPAAMNVAASLLDAGQGHIKLLTLAPERDHEHRVTQWLTEQGVVVAGGHSNASLETLKRAIDAGMRLFTHLGNGCPPALPRHDNIIQRVLSLRDQLHISFIADGHHIPPFALKNYLSMMPSDKVIIVTDAISAAGLGPGRYRLGDQTVEVDASGAAWSADRTHFAGSAATMPGMVEVLRAIGIDNHQILKWTTQNPANLLD